LKKVKQLSVIEDKGSGFIKSNWDYKSPPFCFACFLQSSNDIVNAAEFMNNSNESIIDAIILIGEGAVVGHQIMPGVFKGIGASLAILSFMLTNRPPRRIVLPSQYYNGSYEKISVKIENDELFKIVKDIFSLRDGDPKKLTFTLTLLDELDKKYTDDYSKNMIKKIQQKDQKKNLILTNIKMKLEKDWR